MQRSQGLACGSGGSADFRPLERDFLTPCTQAINPTNRPKPRAPALSQTLLLLLLLLLTAGSYASALPCPCQTSARLRLNGFVGNTLNFAISNAPPGSKFDL